MQDQPQFIEADEKHRKLVSDVAGAAVSSLIVLTGTSPVTAIVSMVKIYVGMLDRIDEAAAKDFVDLLAKDMGEGQPDEGQPDDAWIAILKRLSNAYDAQIAAIPDEEEPATTETA